MTKKEKQQLRDGTRTKIDILHRHLDIEVDQLRKAINSNNIKELILTKERIKTFSEQLNIEVEKLAHIPS